MSSNFYKSPPIIQIPIEVSAADNDDPSSSSISSPQSLHIQEASISIRNSQDGDDEKLGNDEFLVSDLAKANYFWPANSISQSLYLMISMISACIVLALEIYIFYVFSNNLTQFGSETKIKSIQTYLGLFIFATAYQFFITYISILKKNSLQLSILLLFLILMIIYSGVQFSELRHNLIDELEGNWKKATYGCIIIIIIVLCFTLISESLLVFTRLKDEFGWDIYRTIGSSIQLKRQHSFLQFYKALILFDAFFFPAFTIQFIIINLQRTDPEFYITIVILPITFIVLFIANYSATKELKKLLALCIILYLCGLAYVFFKIIRLYTYAKYDPNGYLPGRKSLTTFAVITILFLMFTIASTIIVWSNFNKSSQLEMPKDSPTIDKKPIIID